MVIYATSLCLYWIWSYMPHLYVYMGYGHVYHIPVFIWDMVTYATSKKLLSVFQVEIGLIPCLQTYTYADVMKLIIDDLVPGTTVMMGSNILTMVENHVWYMCIRREQELTVPKCARCRTTNVTIQ
jgi:hypothetical protein